MVHGGLGFKATWTPAEMFALAVRNGRRATGAPGSGELVAGNPADFVVIDLDRLDRDQIMPVDPMALLFARGNASLVKEVVVAGKTIAKDGACMGVDLPAIEQELRAMYRVNVGKLAKFPADVAAAVGAGLRLVRAAAHLRIGRGATPALGPADIKPR